MLDAQSFLDKVKIDMDSNNFPKAFKVDGSESRVRDQL